MKNIFTNSVAYLLLFVALAGMSCKKSFLEITPKGKLIAETTEDYDLLLNNFDFLNMLVSFGGGAAQVAMGDEMAAMDPYFSGSELRTQRLFKWEGKIYEPNQDADELLVPMRNIYAFNKIINEVMESSGGTEQRKKSIRAEALVGRAWTYFLLINYYGKPYNEITSASDPGFPLVKEADVTENNFIRASVKEVYDFIVDDLQTAIPDLPVALSQRLRMSQPLGEALLGKVLFFMGQFDEGLPHLVSAKNALSEATIDVKLIDYSAAFATGGIFTPVDMFGPNTPLAPDNPEVIFAKQFTNFWNYVNNELVVTSETADLYHANDMRLEFYSNAAFFGSAFPNGMLRKVGPLTTQFGFTVPDLFLLIAEGKARTGDLPGAVSDLETFREHRIQGTDAMVPEDVSKDRNLLVKFVFDERLREFAAEGYRWFDMRRLSVDQEFSSMVKNTHYLFDADGSVIETFNLEPERLAMRFPEKLMIQNPSMNNNP